MTRTDTSDGALDRSAGVCHEPASAASLGPAMRPTHHGEVSLVNLKTDPHADYDVYIGHQRPAWMWKGGYYLPRSKWANPFNKAYRRGEITVDEALERYEAHVLGDPELVAALPELRGKVLACWCSPGPCHGGVLARMADGGGDTAPG